jgi:hypothetical protein
MIRKHSKSSQLFRALTLALLVAGSLRAASDNAFFGRWALTIPTGAAGWLEIRPERGWIDGSLLWGGGSVLPVEHVMIVDGVLTVTRLREFGRRDAAGKVVRKQQLTDTITGKVDGDTLKLVIVAPREDGSGFDRDEFSGRRTPPLPPKPDLARIKFGPEETLFNGRDLSGWRVLEPEAPNAWVARNGVLANESPAHVPGQPRIRYANLRTERDFEDFNLRLEVNVPAGGNSGVYLRGIYEVQVADSLGKPLDSHNMGAIYSRITPRVGAEKPAGQWQTLDMTVVDRHATVILNGVKIIDNEPLLGCTGAALWSDQFKPGPIYLQGDHGAVSFRNLVLRRVLK